MMPAALMAGEVVVVDIGVPQAIIDDVPGERLESITHEQASTWVETRRDDIHKGECGRVVIVAGSVGKAGAAQLAALGALRSGAGLVTVATPRSCLGVVAGFMPEYMTLGLDETTDGMVAETAVDAVLGYDCDVLAVGPGLGLGSSVRRFVQELVKRATVPLVLDADALNAFDGELDGLAGRDGREVVITPHPGEMARLAGTTTDHVRTRRLESARALATTRCLYVVLKGAHTVVVSPEGRVLVNLTGNPGMATGGTGDVLTGVVAAWLAQMGIAEVACGLGVYLHGAAGDRAAELHGEVAMIASDLADCLGPALLDLSRSVEEDGASRG
jgi:NAD(P)H-hydrate epimerase